MKKNAMNYEAPEIELVDVAVEGGFELSYNYVSIEEYDEVDNLEW